MAKTALIVDDVAFVRNYIKDILTSAKWNVVAEAENGEEAIVQYLKHKPDLVTMDIVMPKRGGIEATRKILERDREARIIIISAMAHELLLMEAINAGVRDYILKPFTRNDLLNSIERLFTEEDEESEKKPKEKPGKALGSSYAKKTK